MVELVTTVFITASSVLLFGYWFRYTCLLIVSAKTTRDFATDVARANQLHFPTVQSLLRESGVGDLDRLRDSLDRDYRVLSYLLKHAPQPSSQESTLETRMLAINYRLMHAWFGISRRISVRSAHQALNEMSMVVAQFGNSMGERSACGAAA